MQNLRYFRKSTSIILSALSLFQNNWVVRTNWSYFIFINLHGFNSLLDNAVHADLREVQSSSCSSTDSSSFCLPNTTVYACGDTRLLFNNFFIFWYVWKDYWVLFGQLLHLYEGRVQWFLVHHSDVLKSIYYLNSPLKVIPLSQF